MSKKLPTGITKEFLEQVAIPNHGGRYTVISHKSIIDNAAVEITAHGFIPETELYRASINGNVANGMVMLNYATDADLKMMLVWGNSYDKSTRFKCGIGAYIESTGNYMFAGDLSNYSRKHTGNADQEALLKMRYQLAQAKFFYNMLVDAKQKMEAVEITERKMAEILGVIYAEKELITIEQVSSIKSYMAKGIISSLPGNNLWNFYNVICMALRNSHPKNWFESQTGVHQFIMNEILFAPAPVAQPDMQDIPEDVQLNVQNSSMVEYSGEDITVNVRQLDLYDAIAEAETESLVSQQTVSEESEQIVESEIKETISTDEENFFNFDAGTPEPESLDFPDL
jgi:hypothetical protein